VVAVLLVLGPGVVALAVGGNEEGATEGDESDQIEATRA